MVRYEQVPWAYRDIGKMLEDVGGLQRVGIPFQVVCGGSAGSQGAMQPLIPSERGAPASITEVALSLFGILIINSFQKCIC